jgi:D-3-phosphoglycerate dehydrogenase
MIAMPNHIVPANNTTKEGKWLKNDFERSELNGKTLAILGLGRIGLALAVRARGFHMNVVGYHPDVHFTDFAEIRNSLEETLAEAHFVSLHMPLKEETRGMINKDTLKLFHDGAYLINTSRGAIVVEQDIADALKSGKLGGYAADVFEPEPPGDSPLFHAPNTICTPHLGASSKENMLRIGSMIERTIAEYTKGHLH